MNCESKLVWYEKVVEFFYRLISNADYDIIEKSDIETISAFEGSGKNKRVHQM